MRIIEGQLVADKIAAAYMDITCNISEEMKNALNKAKLVEESETGKEVLQQILDNAVVAHQQKIPLCQDCGVAVVFVEHGEEVRVTGGIRQAIIDGVKIGYDKGYLRKSMVAGIERKNTGDNTPPIIHFNLVPGDSLKIHVAAKGGGSENMSQLKMMTPAQGVNGIKEFVKNVVTEAGPNPCPPIILGVGIGGNFETCAILAKKSLFRHIDSKNPNAELAQLEEDLLQIANQSGVGPQGLGGVVTCLGVNVEMLPCHLASFPVAVNVECHSHRHTTIEL
jgi:fumarate hydratase subunit alpha